MEISYLDNLDKKFNRHFNMKITIPSATVQRNGKASYEVRFERQKKTNEQQWT